MLHRYRQVKKVLAGDSSINTGVVQFRAAYGGGGWKRGVSCFDVVDQKVN